MVTDDIIGWALVCVAAMIIATNVAMARYYRMLSTQIEDDQWSRFKASLNGDEQILHEIKWIFRWLTGNVPYAEPVERCVELGGLFDGYYYARVRQDGCDFVGMEEEIGSAVFSTLSCPAQDQRKQEEASADQSETSE